MVKGWLCEAEQWNWKRPLSTTKDTEGTNDWPAFKAENNQLVPKCPSFASVTDLRTAHQF